MLYIGTGEEAHDLFVRSASGSSSAINLYDLPTDGSTVYVRLQYKEEGVWKVTDDYNYTASN